MIFCDQSQTLCEMMIWYPKKYICVNATRRNEENIIQEAVVLNVFSDLEDAKNKSATIRMFMNEYADFDIIYGELQDYLNTRRKRMSMALRNPQQEIDELMWMLWKKMSIYEIFTDFPNQYVCVHDVVKDAGNVILEARVIKVFDTLDMVKDEASDIRRMIKKYTDFEIVYGNFYDYMYVRQGMAHPGQRYMQREMDWLLWVLT